MTTLDCHVLGDLFGREEVRWAFDSSALVQAWFAVEQTLARAEAEVGIVPAAADRIEREAVADLYDLDEVPQALVLAGVVVEQVAAILEGLVVDKARMPQADVDRLAEPSGYLGPATAAADAVAARAGVTVGVAS